MISFDERNDVLVAIYEPDQPIDNWDKKQKEQSSFKIKNTFQLSKAQIIVKECSSYKIVFRIGTMCGDYYKLDRKVFGIANDVYIHKDISLRKELFVTSRNISLFPHILKIIKTDFYIDPNDNKAATDDNHISIRTYRKLLASFPNSTELTKYSDARISVIFSEYFNVLKDHKKKYESYMEKKKVTDSVGLIDLKEKRLELLLNAYATLSDMLKKSKSYLESSWQEKIKDILCLLFPQYVCALRHVSVGSKGEKKRTPDFLLINAYGSVDVMEIKKPDDIQIMRDIQVRNNFIPQKLFLDTLIQTSVYIHALNSHNEKNTERIEKRLKKDHPSLDLKIRINNPQGIVLFGRSDKLSPEQQFDYELIRRQYKDISTIMTYDDLLFLLKNLIDNLKKA